MRNSYDRQAPRAMLKFYWLWNSGMLVLGDTKARPHGRIFHGQREARAHSLPPKRKCSYASSITSHAPCCLHSSAISSIISLGKTTPVGLPTGHVAITTQITAVGKEENSANSRVHF